MVPYTKFGISFFVTFMSTSVQVMTSQLMEGTRVPKETNQSQKIFTTTPLRFRTWAVGRNSEQSIAMPYTTRLLGLALIVVASITVTIINGKVDSRIVNEGNASASVLFG